jgi:hypothetical protein
MPAHPDEQVWRGAAHGYFEDRRFVGPVPVLRPAIAPQPGIGIGPPQQLTQTILNLQIGTLHLAALPGLEQPDRGLAVANQAGQVLNELFIADPVVPAGGGPSASTGRI